MRLFRWRNRSQRVDGAVEGESSEDEYIRALRFATGSTKAEALVLVTVLLERFPALRPPAEAHPTDSERDRIIEEVLRMQGTGADDHG